MKKIPLGIDDYRALIQECYYVDKTALIREIIDTPSESVLLFTRPRRFGKTLALSMVDTFFDAKIEDNASYFVNTAIADDPEAMKEAGGYPTVFLSFKDCHAMDYAEMEGFVSKQIRDEYRRHDELRDFVDKDGSLKSYYDAFLKGGMPPSESASSLFNLTRMLQMRHGKSVVLLIDEYDTPIQSAYDNGFYPQAIHFMRRLYGLALKGNRNLRVAVTTGVTRIGKESIFSGLNNVVVSSVLDQRTGEFFGFTEEETKKLLDYYGLGDRFENIKDYYDGYVFGSSLVFNPWSTLYCIRNEGRFDTYWANTSSDQYIASVLKKNQDIVPLVTRLLNGEKVYAKLNENFAYGEEDMSNLLSLLVSTGYLTAVPDVSTGFHYVSLPNLEMKELFARVALASRSGSALSSLLQLKDAFIRGDIKAIGDYLNGELLQSMSYFDFAEERNYQAMMLTFTSLLFREMDVRSEVLEGTGRCDLWIRSRNRSLAVVIELKKAKARVSSANLMVYAKSALRQIEEKGYLRSAIGHYDRVVAFGMAFYKNSVQVVSKTY